jgi:hypothetical protein
LLLTLAALAAVATEPQPQGNQAQWIRSSDFPLSVWSHATLTSYDLTLDTEGRPIRCEITHSSGSAKIDTVICSSLMRRAHYKPALDANGLAVPAVVRDQVVWNPQGSGGNDVADMPDIIVQLDRSMLKKASSLTVVEVIAPSGTIKSCVAENGGSDDDLAKAACDIIARPQIATQVRDASGTPVRGVRAFDVGFVPGPEAKITIR